jgi:hypothetical protein
MPARRTQVDLVVFRSVPAVVVQAQPSTLEQDQHCYCSVRAIAALLGA